MSDHGGDGHTCIVLLIGKKINKIKKEQSWRLPIKCDLIKLPPKKDPPNASQTV